MDEGTATATLKNAGLNPTVKYESHEDQDDGKVISQSIDANTETAKNSSIEIVVNKIEKQNKTIRISVNVKSIMGNSTQNSNTTNETENQSSTANVTILIDGSERTQENVDVNNSSFVYTYTSTGTHEITVKVGSSYTRTRRINFDESENNRQVIFDSNTTSD